MIDMQKGRGNTFRKMKLGIKLDNFNDFKSQWKKITIDDQFESLTELEMVQFWQEKIDDLLKDSNRSCYLLEPKISEKSVQIAREVVLKDFAGKVDTDYASLFMGKPKQLLVYRDCSQICKFLERYRMPAKYQKKHEELEVFLKKKRELILKRNQAISFERDQQIQSLSLQLKQLKEGAKYNKSLKEYCKVIREMIEDFKTKQKVTQILLLGIRDCLVEDIKKIAEEFELVLKNKYYQVEKDEFKEIQILKNMVLQIEEEDEDEYVYRAHEHEDDVFSDDEEQHSEDSWTSKTVKQKKLKLETTSLKIPPKPYSSTFLTIEPNGTMIYLVQLSSSSKKDKVSEVVVKSPFNKDFQLIYEIDDKLQCHITIVPFQSGYTSYIVKTRNEAGQSYGQHIINVYHHLDSKLQPLKNRPLHFLGKTDEGLIPAKKGEEYGKQSHTAKAIEPSIFSGLDFSVGSQLGLCSDKGALVGWGSMYVHDTPENETELLLDLVLKVESYRAEQPCILINGQHIIKVSCGKGYCLAVDILGHVWSFGTNSLGELGRGNSEQSDRNLDPRVVSGLSDRNIFITDVKATSCGACFALSHQGVVYRWGAQQTDTTNYPVKNRFGDLINFTSKNQIIKQSDPIPISSKSIQFKVTKIQAGNDFFFALTDNGTLYGWGETAYLGIQKLIDNQEVSYLHNPIQLMKGVKDVICGNQHVIVVMKDGTILGWGHSRGLLGRGQKQKLIRDPVNLKSTLGSYSEGMVIKCGQNFTVKVVDSQMTIIGGNEETFLPSYQLPGRVHKLECRNELICLQIQ